MKYSKIPPLEKKLLNVIIETPKGSQNKFDYEPILKLFILKKTLPMGMVFPFDFGFIPHTKGADGDPLDVLVMMDQPSFPGCLVKTRLIGVLEAEQTEKDGPTIRNDRIVGVADCSSLYKGIQHLDELNKNMLREIENFFVDYNKQEERKFSPLGWKKHDVAYSLVKTQLVE